MNGRKETTHIEKIDFAKKLRKIDPCSGIPDFFTIFPKLWWKNFSSIISSSYISKQLFLDRIVWVALENASVVTLQ